MRLRGHVLHGLILLVGLLSLAAVGCGSSGSNTSGSDTSSASESNGTSGALNVIGWTQIGLDDPGSVKYLEKKYGFNFKLTPISSELDPITQARTNPGYYSVMYLAGSNVGAARTAGVLEPIDTSKVPNWNDLEPQFKKPPYVVDGKVYLVPFLWGATPLIFNPGDQSRPTSLNALWSPANKGKVTMQDDAATAIFYSALHAGQDPSHITDMNSVKASLGSLMGNAKAVWQTENQLDQQWLSGAVSLGVGWTGAVGRLQNKIGPDKIQMAMLHGATMGWTMGVGIPKDAPNPGAAYAYINYMVSPEFIKIFSKTGEGVGGNVPTTSRAIKALPADSIASHLQLWDHLDDIRWQPSLSLADQQELAQVYQSARAG